MGKSQVAFSEIGLITTFVFQAEHPVMVDVGAHHGSSSKWFATHGWRVLAFEPEPGNRAAFERNLDHMENVTCLPLAVSDVTGTEVPFFVSREHFGIHSLTPFHDTHERAFNVSTVRLDDVLKEQEIDHVALLKVDVEGADFQALRGFDIDRFQPELVMLEFMDERTKPAYSYDHHDVAHYMTGRGYSAFVSEWAPINEYAREGVSTAPHRWLGCGPYPLDHAPAWGNLIFVPKARAADFEQTLKNYLEDLRRNRPGWLRSVARRIPGARRVYSFLKNLYSR